jgi:hypothetical protein
MTKGLGEIKIIYIQSSLSPGVVFKLYFSGRAPPLKAT